MFRCLGNIDESGNCTPKNGKGWSVEGIASWSTNPCPSTTFPGVYTNVNYYTDWIKSKLPQPSTPAPPTEPTEGTTATTAATTPTQMATRPNPLPRQLRFPMTQKHLLLLLKWQLRLLPQLIQQMVPLQLKVLIPLRKYKLL